MWNLIDDLLYSCNGIFYLHRFEFGERSLSQTKNQVEEIIAERDKLAEALKQSNLEFAAKLDTQKSENENKISFLVQQLRSAEEKVKNSAVGAVSTPKSVSVPGSSEVLSPSSMAFSKMFENNLNSNSYISRPSTANAVPSWGRGSVHSFAAGEVTENSKSSPVEKKSQLLHKDRDTVLTGSISSTNHTAIDDIQRKWQAERQRREQLEKRNMELTRELRSIRKSNNT